MLIRVKEEGLNKKKRKNREREKRTIERKKKAKILRSSLLDHEFFGGGRLWFYAIP